MPIGDQQTRADLSQSPLRPPVRDGPRRQQTLRRERRAGGFQRKMEERLTTVNHGNIRWRDWRPDALNNLGPAVPASPLTTLFPNSHMALFISAWEAFCL